VRVARADDSAFLISVRDDGVGLPAGYNPSTSKRLGSRLIMALSKQLGAELSRPASAKGTHFMLRVPLKATPGD
jgi:two-component sensor histidine kinase